ncbi:MAG: hypothetical protein LBQ28_02000 [Prevotellaceae bacterium]|jgi:hypothetical protein|nr:hypothetical protein [Prevotellaceae bacterium]
MKNILKLMAILLILTGSFSCGKEEKMNSNQLDGYVVGWEGCSGSTIQGEYGEANAYYIISSDLRDTLLTYNFPKDIFNFPATCFENGNIAFSTPVWFNTSFRYAFKVHIEYEIVPEEIKIYPVCSGIVLIHPEADAQQINIKSAIKIN